MNARAVCPERPLHRVPHSACTSHIPTPTDTRPVQGSGGSSKNHRSDRVRSGQVGSGQVRSARVSRSLKTHGFGRIGPGRVTSGPVGSGGIRKISRVGLNRVRLSDPAHDPTRESRPGPRVSTRPAKSPDFLAPAFVSAHLESLVGSCHFGGENDSAAL